MYNSNYSATEIPRAVEFGNYQNNVQPTNGMAIAGFVLSMIGCGFPVGLILSSIALGQFKKDPNQKGKGLAIAGLVIGIISVVFGFFYIVILSAGLSGY
jgi:thiol:disulfide interchange protein